MFKMREMKLCVKILQQPAGARDWLAWRYGAWHPRDFFPINAPGMDCFQLLNLGCLGCGLELRFWVVIAIIVSLTITITLITTLTII